MTEAEILTILSKFMDPYLQQDWVSSKQVRLLTIQNQKAQLEVTLGYPFEDIREKLTEAVKGHCQRHFPQLQLDIQFISKFTSHEVQKLGLQFHPEVKNVIAVGSGKGGVGKSTVAINLAYTLKAQGARVGVLDADIHGPNQPLMLGVTSQSQLKTAEGLMPLIQHGLQTMSMGYLVDSKTPVIWRGPMISQALQQLYYETHWENLDYLVIDLPPGTGDILLTLTQKIPVTGAVIVTTPQEVAVSDARKALAMFHKMNVKVLGVIENMSGYQCTHCGHQEAIFGQGGGERLAKEMQSEFLGAIPLDANIRLFADAGNPWILSEPGNNIAQIYAGIARGIAAKISLLPKNYRTKMPSVLVE